MQYVITMPNLFKLVTITLFCAYIFLVAFFVSFMAFQGNTSVRSKKSTLKDQTTTGNTNEGLSLSVEENFSFVPSDDPLIRPQCQVNNPCINLTQINWRMYILVKSAREHTLRRMNIRSTWGAIKYVAGGQFSTFFLIGSPSATSNDTIQSELIEEESKRFSDIIQINEADDYKSVVLKTLAGMKWASEHLQNDDFYSSADDDMIVNLGQLQENIDKHIEVKEKNKWPEFPLMCAFESWKDPWVPIRLEKHKNYVSISEYKWPKWPKFCLGGMYTTSVSVIKQLYEVSKTRKPLRTDDVWITGILRNILGMPSSMLVYPEPAIAQHRQVYNNKANAERATEQFHHYWRTAFNEFSKKHICKC